MELNPNKCIFRVSLGKFLGFMVSYKGIKANLEKITDVVEMKSPCTLKEIQSLRGKLTALNRFISHAMDKCHIFFQVMKRRNKTKKTSECKEAFQ